MKITTILEWWKKMLLKMLDFCKDGSIIIKLIKFVIFWIPLLGPVIILIWWWIYEKQKNKS